MATWVASLLESAPSAPKIDPVPETAKLEVMRATPTLEATLGWSTMSLAPLTLLEAALSTPLSVLHTAPDAALLKAPASASLETVLVMYLALLEVVLATSLVAGGHRQSCWRSVHGKTSALVSLTPPASPLISPEKCRKTPPLRKRQCPTSALNNKNHGRTASNATLT